MGMAAERPAADKMPAVPEPLLVTEGLKQHFPLRLSLGERLVGKQPRNVHAVDGVDLEIQRGETVGLVGESGSGKSTFARSILRLHEPTAGKVLFQGENILDLPPSEMRVLRRDMQIIFQDPYASLNPRRTVEQIVGLPLRIQGLGGSQVRRRVAELLEQVGLHPTQIDRFPHQFSGGQRQRIGIARALAVNPTFIVADEPVSALDVSIQAQIINLMERLQAEYDLTYLFITHDLSVVSYVSNRIAVMYMGQIVELADSEELFTTPLHPYTQALLSAIPRVEKHRRGHRERIILQGSQPTPINPPRGCRFYSRCFLEGKNETCRVVNPPLVDMGGGHKVACHVVAGTN